MDINTALELPRCPLLCELTTKWNKQLRQYYKPINTRQKLGRIQCTTREDTRLANLHAT